MVDNVEKILKEQNDSINKVDSLLPDEASKLLAIINELITEIGINEKRRTGIEQKTK